MLALRRYGRLQSSNSERPIPDPGLGLSPSMVYIFFPSMQVDGIFCCRLRTLDRWPAGGIDSVANGPTGPTVLSLFNVHPIFPHSHRIGKTMAQIQHCPNWGRSYINLEGVQGWAFVARPHFALCFQAPTKSVPSETSFQWIQATSLTHSPLLSTL